MDEETIQILELVFSGLTAIGTVGAVCISLWLARRSETPRLRVRARLEPRTIDVSGPEPVDEWRVNVWVTNTGVLPQTLRGVIWKLGWFCLASRGQPVPMDDVNIHYSKRMRISYGEQTRFSIKRDDFQAEMIRPLTEEWSKKAAWLVRHLARYTPTPIRCEVVSTTPGRQKVIIDRDVAELIREALRTGRKL